MRDDGLPHVCAPVYSPTPSRQQLKIYMLNFNPSTLTRNHYEKSIVCIDQP